MQTTTNATDLLSRFESLVSGHAELCAKELTQLTMVVGEFLPGFLAARKKWAVSQRKTADDFNLFRVIGVETKEVVHSTLLAWLLDSQIETGTHAQGNLGFRLFLEEFARELRLDGGDTSNYTDANYWVVCEVHGLESRVDIEIASQNRFLIHIENKIHSAEGDDQTNREWRDMQSQRKMLGVPEDRCHAIFLTLRAIPARNPNFHAIGWSRIAKLLDRFAHQAEPSEVKLFVRHYAKAIRALSVVTHEEMEVGDADL